MILAELFKSTYSFKSHLDDGDHAYWFVTDDGDEVYCQFLDTPVRLGPTRKISIFEFEFSRAGDYGLTQRGDAVKIMATTLAILEEFLTDFHPPCFYFTSKESSRTKLYNAMAKRFTSKAQALGYKQVKQLPDSIYDKLSPFDRDIFERNEPFFFLKESMSF